MNVAPLPPQSLDAEESCLGACLISPGAVDACAEILTPEAFYRQSHGMIFKAILDVSEKGAPVDALTVVGRLDADGKLGELPGQVEATRVHELAAIGFASPNAVHWAKIVRAMWLKRELIRAGNEIVSLGYDGTGPMEEIVAEADGQLLRLQSQVTKNRDRVFTGQQLVAEYREVLANPLDEDKLGVRPPFLFLPPLMGSRLYVLGGYTADGKTAMGLQFLASACEAGARVGFHSIEMSRTDLMHRLVAARSQTPYHDIRTGRISSVNRPAVEKALEEIDGWDFDVIDDEQIVPSQVRRDQRAGKYDFLIEDHLHRMPIKDKRHERAELEDHVRRTTNIAKEFDIPVLLLAQLSREDKRNPFPRPTLASLKGTGAIEQEAATVWFVYRIRDKDHNPQNDAELITAKNRHGGLGFKNLYFRASQVRFAEGLPSFA